MGDIPLPTSERQARPLAGLSPKMVAKVWKQAVEQSNTAKLTGQLVSQVVREMSEKPRFRKNTPSIPYWQQLVLPLLKEALAKTRSGDQAGVVEVLNKALLRVEIGRNTASEVDK
jgi:hypothetical protein